MIQVILGKDTFTVGAVKPRRSFPLQARLWPLVLEAAGLLAKLSAVSGGKSPAGEESETAPSPAEDPAAEKPFERIAKLFARDVEEILPLIGGAFSSLSYDDLAFIQRELLSETLVNGHRLYADKSGVPDQFDTVMAGRTIDTWRLMWAALKETYPDFLSPLLARLGREGVLSVFAK